MYGGVEKALELELPGRPLATTFPRPENSEFHKHEANGGF